MEKTKQPTTTNNNTPSPPPLSLLRSIPYFMLPALFFLVISWWGVEALNNAGVPLIWSFTLLIAGSLAILGCLAVILAKRESVKSLRSRLWLSPFRVSDVLIGLAVGFAGLTAYKALQGVTSWILSFWPYGFPSWATQIFGNGTFFGISVAENSWLIILFLFIYLANVVGEELWWRGYILPRQVKSIGANAWIANGLLWSLFHLFQPWDIISLIPIALGISFMSQYRNSAWIAIIAHGVLNSIAWIPLIKLAIQG